MTPPLPYHAADNIRIEHWDVAMDMGRVAARNMLGAQTPYRGVPFFWTGQFGKSVRYAGNAMAWDEVILQGRADGTDPKFVAYFVAPGGAAISAVATLDRDPQAVAAQELFRLGRMPTPAQVRGGGGGAAAEFDLKDYLAQQSRVA